MTDVNAAVDPLDVVPDPVPETEPHAPGYLSPTEQGKPNPYVTAPGEVPFPDGTTHPRPGWGGQGEFHRPIVGHEANFMGRIAALEAQLKTANDQNTALAAQLKTANDQNTTLAAQLKTANAKNTEAN